MHARFWTWAPAEWGKSDSSQSFSASHQYFGNLNKSFRKVSLLISGGECRNPKLCFGAQKERPRVSTLVPGAFPPHTPAAKAAGSMTVGYSVLSHLPAQTLATVQGHHLPKILPRDSSLSVSAVCSISCLESLTW